MLYITQTHYLWLKIYSMPEQRGKTVSVYLDQDLDGLVIQDSKQKKWSKSQVINEIVREYYLNQGKAKASYDEYEESQIKE